MEAETHNVSKVLSREADVTLIQVAVACDAGGGCWMADNHPHGPNHVYAASGDKHETCTPVCTPP
jgi:hypothetical protein